MLDAMRIGTLPEKDRITASSNPYANDPKRDPAISARSTTPFNGEAPLSALLTFITPTELHFKRNHMPVPDAVPEAYELQVCCYPDSHVPELLTRPVRICLLCGA